MKTNILTLILISIITFSANAAVLKGKVVEAATSEPMIQASVRVLAQKDSTLVKGAVTNTDGQFTIENLKAGKYIAEVSYVGFQPQFLDFTMGKENLTLKDFSLTESSIMLKEATVTGIKTPMKVMEDTIEFNADSYKTQPNAVVQDLLKRLPGVEVGSDGGITANGKTVSKILVDGKEFFSDDPKVASRNLPVDMVDKLQVVDRKSELARMTGVDDGEDETVINLTVKKNMKNGWFGKVEGGYGTDSRYRGTFTVNRFWNDNQITFLGGANNVNEPAFTDGASGRFMRFGGNNGINKAHSFGVNFNVGNGEIFRVGGNVLYSHSDIDSRTSSDRMYLFTDSTSTQTSSRNSRDKGDNFRVDLRLQWKPDSLNTLEFRPNVSLNFNNSEYTSLSNTYAGIVGQPNVRGGHVTKSENMGDSKGRSFELGGRLIFNHNFKQRKGRSLSLMANYNMSNRHENSNSFSDNRFYARPPVLDYDSAYVYDQYTRNHTWNNNVGARVTWTEPLGNPAKGNFLTIAYNFSYRWNNADKMVYDYPVNWPLKDENGNIIFTGDPNIDYNSSTWNQTLSNQFRNDYMNQDIRVGYRYVSLNHNLNVGMSLVPQMSKSIDLIDHNKDVSRNILNYAPFLRYRWKISKTRSMNMFYNGRSSQPSISQLQPVPDMSDPLNIVIGNPDLNPSFSHSLNLRFQDFNQEAQRSIMAMLDGSFQQNAIVSSTVFDPQTGGRTTRYKNVNGIWNVRGMNMLSFPLRNKAFTINNHLHLNYSRSVGYNNDVENWSGNFGVGESFGIAWRPENLEIEVRPRYNLQLVQNTVQKNSDRTVHSYGGSIYGTYYFNFGLSLNTDLNYSATEGYSDGYDTKTWMWNASVSYQFLSNKSATVTLKAYDILGQRSNISRNVTANYIDDSRYNSLTRYVMLSFSYNFNTFGNNKPKDRNAWEGPEGMPAPPNRGNGGGGRMMGPPPGM